MSDAFVQVASDAGGKRIGNFAVTLPVGTLVTDADGNVTTLAAPVTVFLQRVALAGSDGSSVGVENGRLRVDSEDPDLQTLMTALVSEVHLLRQAFQGWAGVDEPIDSSEEIFS